VKTKKTGAPAEIAAPELGAIAPIAKTKAPSSTSPVRDPSLALPSNTSKKPGLPIGLSGNAGEPAVSTPKFNLAAALADPTFTALDPAKIEVPPAILDRLAQAKRVLLIGHTGPDGDCVGSTLAMARALKVLGKEADVCVDDDLGGQLRRIDSQGEVRRAAQLEGQSWDLALIMDVSMKARIGGAVDLLKNASAVAIADHHVAEPSREDLGLPADKPFESWVMPDYPAAALMAAAMLARLGPALKEHHADLTSIYLPALCGFATDTGFGNYQGLDKEYFRYFKHMAQQSAKLGMPEIGEALRYDLPPALEAFLKGTSQQLDHPAIQARQADGTGLRIEQHPGAEGGLGLVTLGYDQLQDLLAFGRKDDPKLIDSDVINTIKWSRPNALKKAGAKMTVFMHQDVDRIFASFRSDGTPDLALHLAQHMGGGGHSMAAGAAITGMSLEDAKAKVIAWCKGHGIVA
jgi:phosphoesterase RecJ-like protein